MALYPIISNYDKFDLNKIELGEPKINLKESIILPNEKYKETYYNYSINYKYDRLGINQFCITTPFLKITENIKSYGETLQLNVDIGKDLKFKNLIINIIENIKIQMMKNHPNILLNDIHVPIYTTEEYNTNNKQNISINLQHYKKKIITPIHYHQTKKQGGDIVSIINKSDQFTDNFLEKIKEHMTMFRSKKYGKSNGVVQKIDEKTNQKINLPEMYYEGKFILFFTMTCCEEKSDDKNLTTYCKIHIFAKECEIKMNLSNVKSILDFDMYDVSKINTKQPNQLSI